MPSSIRVFGIHLSFRISRRWWWLGNSHDFRENTSLVIKVLFVCDFVAIKKMFKIETFSFGFKVVSSPYGLENCTNAKR